MRFLIYHSKGGIVQSTACFTVTPVMASLYHPLLLAVHGSPKKSLWVTENITSSPLESCASLSNRAKTLCLCFCNALRVHSSSQKSGRRCSGHAGVCISVSSWASGVDVCFSSALFGLSVTPVTHIPVWTAWLTSHSLNQPPVACACVDVCLCGSM